jgi:hypothetical protein
LQVNKKRREEINKRKRVRQKPCENEKKKKDKVK